MTLENQFLSFAHDVVGLMHEECPDGVLPMLKRRKMKFSSDGWDEVEEGEVNPWATLPDDSAKHITELDATKECVLAHVESGVITMPNMSSNDGQPILKPTYEQYSPSISRELTFPVLHAVIQEKSLQPSDKQILESYRLYHDSWADTHTHQHMYVPLLNMGSDLDQYDIDDGLSIEHMSADHKADAHWLFRGGFLDDSPTPSDLHSCTHVLVWRYSHVKLSPSPKWEEYVGLLLSAFRLYRSGSLGSKYQVHDSLAPYPRTFGLGGGPLENFWVSGHGKKYLISESDLPQVNKIYSNLRVLLQDDKLSDLRVALRRFNQSYGRKLAEDRIIDLTIALESVLLWAVKNELQYKLSNRGAMLLSGDRDPLVVRSLLQLLYTVRSAIVHEGVTLADIPSQKSLKKALRRFNDELTPHQLPEYCEDVTRQVILKYVERLIHMESIQNINRQLDDEMLINTYEPKNAD